MVYMVSSNNLQDINNKKVNQTDDTDQNLHNSLKFFMIFSQILGLLPVNNVTKSYTKLNFKWKSFKVLNTFIMLLLTTFMVLSCICAWYKYGTVLTNATTFVFFASTVISIFLYLRLAKRWPRLMRTWCQMDKKMNEAYGYPPSLEKRLKISTVIFVSLAMLDFIMNLYNKYNSLMISNGPHYDEDKLFFENFSYLFNIVPLNIITKAYCVLVTLHSTVVQAYNDLFIILLSITLALRFKQITKRIEQNYMKMKPHEFWVEIREDYDRLSMLCKELDDNISYIVLLAYSMNLFFLLIQLFQSLEAPAGLIGKLYLVFSFIHLIFRIVCVSIYGAWINDESIEPASILHSVSSACYNIEIRRLLMQISLDNVALTGCKMFKITRGIVLSIAGAVVTYELVLIQFNTATTNAK